MGYSFSHTRIENNNCKEIIILDTSNLNEVFESYVLNITVPGIETPYTLNLTTINSTISFKLRITELNQYVVLETGEEYLPITLPDGLYTLEFIYLETEGGEELTTTYSILNQCQTLCIYNKKLCSLRLDGCENCQPSKDKTLKELNEIKSYLDAAKIYVEYCEAPEKGISLNNYALERLNRIKTDCKNC